MKIIAIKDFPLLEDKVNRLITTHAKNGFAVVSAFRQERTREENLKKTEELKSDLKNMGWSYTVAYGGGFKEKGQNSFDTTQPKFNEISFVVYNYNKTKGKELLKDMLALCKKYNQDDIYYQEPNGKAYWYNKEGKKDATFSSMTKNDNGQQFFTGFSTSKLSKKVKDKYLKKDSLANKKAFEHRYSGIMEGVNAPPSTLAEETIRKHNGEVFISTFNVLTNEEAHALLQEDSYFNY